MDLLYARHIANVRQQLLSYERDTVARAFGTKTLSTQAAGVLRTVGWLIIWHWENQIKLKTCYEPCWFRFGFDFAPAAAHFARQSHRARKHFTFANKQSGCHQHRNWFWGGQQSIREQRSAVCVGDCWKLFRHIRLIMLREVGAFGDCFSDAGLAMGWPHMCECWILGAEFG